MKKIASFEVNHDILEKGIYISRIDGDITTYDIRLKKPNSGDAMQNAALHTIEHLAATFARNSQYGEKVIYFGPMGCRTGFYLLLKRLEEDKAIELIKDTFNFIAEYEGGIPGNTSKECGNYMDHDLKGAKNEAAEFLPVIKNYNTVQLKYKA